MDRTDESVDSSGNTVLTPVMSPAARWAVEVAQVNNPNVFNLGYLIDQDVQKLVLSIIQEVLSTTENILTDLAIATIIGKISLANVAASPELQQWLLDHEGYMIVISGTF